MRLLKALLWAAGNIAVVVVGLRVTHPLPARPAGPASAAIPASADTRLGDALLPLVAENPGLSGVVPLADGRDALAARVLLAGPAERLDLVSVCLIPGRAGTDLLEGCVAAGVRTRIVTNSPEATDVPIVHGGWMRHRDRLVRAGAEVLELRARPDRTPDPSRAQRLTGSQSSLHAKTFAVDGQRIFIGAFNFDPRSAMLNTEMGFLIESPGIATAPGRALDAGEIFHRVVAAEDGTRNWIEMRGNGETATDAPEPNTTAEQRAILRAMGWLPVEWVL